LPPPDVFRLTIHNPLTKFQQQLTGMSVDLIDHIIEQIELARRIFSMLKGATASLLSGFYGCDLC